MNIKLTNWATSISNPNLKILHFLQPNCGLIHTNLGAPKSQSNHHCDKRPIKQIDWWFPPCPYFHDFRPDKGESTNDSDINSE